MGYESEIVITELTGKKRSVTLRGGGLPFQGAPYGGTQRLVTTWYPGNTEAAQSVLGPTLKPSAWSGMWRTTLLSRTPALVDLEGGGSGQQVSRADLLRDSLELIFNAGQRLSVTWRNQIGDRPERVITRHGRASDWDFAHDRADDIGWSINWEWVSRGESQQKIARMRSESMTPDMAALMLAAAELAAFGDAVANAQQATSKLGQTFSLDTLMSMVQAPLDVLNGFAQQCKLIANRVGKLGELVNQVKTLPTQLLGQALAVANTAVSTANNFVDTISQTSPEAMTTSASASQLSQAVSYYGDAMTQADLMKARALGLQQQVQSASVQQNTILAVHIVRGAITLDGERGEMLSAISSSYYGSPDQAPSIAKSNGLPLNQQFVERGNVLIIPTLASTRDFTPGGG